LLAPPVEPGLPRPSKADRGPRWLARLFDVWFEIAVLAVLAGLVFGEASAAMLQLFNDRSTSQVAGMLALPFALVLDALIYRAAGNTPGKALVGLKVLTADGAPLTLGQYLRRNFSMWLRGMGLGIPLVSLFTMIMQAQRLSKGEPASYDEADRFQVRVTETGNLRKLAFVAALIVLASFFFGQNNGVWTPLSPDYPSSWQNPLTQLTATIDSNWTNSVQTNADGQLVYVFGDRAERATVIFGREQIPAVSLFRYVDAFKTGTARSLRFSNDGRFFTQDGRQAWQGIGTPADSIYDRLNVEVVETASGFWRLVTIQRPPFTSTDVLVSQLQTALRSTIQ
jgi:uncharacterized RDD family membrane protein YckC